MSGPASVNPNLVELQVGGFAQFSTCDWPGELAATVFCQGCAWDCAYCHNPDLRPMHAESQISWQKVLTFLESRRGLLDGVVFSGGEPTLQAALLNAVQSVRNLGFRVGLHTAGMVPERFAALLPLVDWVGFDVKARFSAYARITGIEESGDKALASLRALLASGVAYEVRTTFYPALLSIAELIELRNQLLSCGVTHYTVQRFRATGVHADRLPPIPEQLPLNLPSDFGHGLRKFILR